MGEGSVDVMLLVEIQDLIYYLFVSVVLEFERGVE